MPTAEEIERAKSPAGAWTRKTLAGWGVPWPPPKGWKKELIAMAEMNSPARAPALTIYQAIDACEKQVEVCDDGGPPMVMKEIRIAPGERLAHLVKAGENEGYWCDVDRLSFAPASKPKHG